MSPHRVGHLHLPGGAPRASGDEPDYAAELYGLPQCSPRERG